MFWRLLGQLLFLLLAMILIQGGAGVAIGLMLRSGDRLPANVFDDFRRAQAWLVSNPLWMALGMLSVALAIWLSVWAAAQLLDRRPLADFGLHLDRHWWADLGFGLALGALLMTLIFLVELAAGWVTVRGTLVTHDPQLGFWPTILASLLLFVAVGFYEELFSRGYQLTNLAEGFAALRPRTAVWLATILSGGVFGLLHLSNPHATWYSALGIAAGGVLTLGLGYILTGELGLSIGLHISWNFVQGNVYGFPVSGGSFFASFLFIEQGGPVLWTGGAFGPEAGLVGLMATLLGALLICAWVRWRRGAIALHTELAEPPASLVGRQGPSGHGA
ncbi:MAG: CPBP family intramembrane metalloprotease [Chloroflexi bacterium]|nr:CPBP family intramembrane metalloprotease [Chloroflexota bacterium]